MSLTADGKELKVAKGDIEQRKKSNLSLMPNGLMDGLSLQDFTDIAQFLEELKQAQ